MVSSGIVTQLYNCVPTVYTTFPSVLLRNNNWLFSLVINGSCSLSMPDNYSPFHYLQLFLLKWSKFKQHVNSKLLNSASSNKWATCVISGVKTTWAIMQRNNEVVFIGWISSVPLLLMCNCLCMDIPVWPGVQWSVEAAVHLHNLLPGSSYWILLLRTALRQVLNTPHDEIYTPYS